MEYSRIPLSQGEILVEIITLQHPPEPGESFPRLDPLVAHDLPQQGGTGRFGSQRWLSPDKVRLIYEPFKIHGVALCRK